MSAATRGSRGRPAPARGGGMLSRMSVPPMDSMPPIRTSFTRGLAGNLVQPGGRRWDGRVAVGRMADPRRARVSGAVRAPRAHRGAGSHQHPHGPLDLDRGPRHREGPPARLHHLGLGACPRGTRSSWGSRWRRSRPGAPVGGERSGGSARSPSRSRSTRSAWRCTSLRGSWGGSGARALPAPPDRDLRRRRVGVRVRARDRGHRGARAPGLASVEPSGRPGSRGRGT